MQQQGFFQLLISTIALLSLGSCATYHTGISRELMTTGGLDGSEKPRLPANQQKAETQTELSELSQLPITPYFEWPVDEARLTRGFFLHPSPAPIARRTRSKKRIKLSHRPHLGIDLAASKNSPIHAAHTGLVIYAGRDFKGYGKMVLIESENGWATLYAHFNKIYVQEGQQVLQGDILGGMGRTGRATGVHLHFEIRKNKGAVDPLPLLPQGERLVTQAF